MFIEAMLLARRRPELAPMIGRTMERLHVEGERAMADKVAAGRWEIRTTPAREARAFWAAVLGVAFEQAVAGELSSRTRPRRWCCSCLICSVTEPQDGAMTPRQPGP